MAAYDNDPLFFTLSGANAGTLVVELDHAVVGTLTVYDAATGWLAGWDGTVLPNGSGGLLVDITTVPAALATGTWTVTVTVDGFGGLTGGGDWDFDVTVDPDPSQYQGPGGRVHQLQGPAKGTAATNKQGQVFHEDFTNRYLVQRQRGAVPTDDGDLFAVPGEAKFDADNYITYPAGQWPLGFGDCTIFFRGELEGISGLARFLGTSSSTGDGDEWRTEFVFEGALLRFMVPIGGTARSSSAFAVSVDTPFTAAVAVSYDSVADETTLDTYKDGALVGSVTYSGALVAPDQGWSLGRWDGSEADGKLTQVLMYDWALDADSIADVHAVSQ
jgi:Concanavalin A-like lectin/glucanases superfamily